MWLLEGQRHSSMITVFISINKILGSNTSTAKKGRMRDSLRERDFEVQKRKFYVTVNLRKVTKAYHSIQYQTLTVKTKLNIRHLLFN